MSGVESKVQPPTVRTEKVKIGTAEQVGSKGNEYESSDTEKCTSP